MERLTSHEIKLLTALAQSYSLSTYANWLEATKSDWRCFPQRKADRCLVRYRKYLIDKRDSGAISSSTAKERMRVIIQFYRWVNANGLLSTDGPMWKDRIINIHMQDAYGFSRTMQQGSSDLSIPNRTRKDIALEDGLLPLSTSDREIVLSFARLHSSPELFLMLSLGFFTGLRIQSISDIKISALLNAIEHQPSSDPIRIQIGPAATPPIATKFGIDGIAYIPKPLLVALLEYSKSQRRLARENRCNPSDSDLLFLTKHGNSYSRREDGCSPAINVAMHNLRKNGIAKGISALRNFHFHQTRCTFATELARTAISMGSISNAIELVRSSLHHKSERTSFQYIRFVQSDAIKHEISNKFTDAFLNASEKAHEEPWSK